MVNYPIQTIESAPEKSKLPMKQLEQAFGFVPNLIGAIANSPVLTNSLVGIFGNVHGGNFTEDQIQILLLTNAVTNSCSWAAAFHSALTLQQGITPEDVQAIRERRLPKNAKYAALSKLARTLIEQRGHLSNEDLTAFVEAGFSPELALEMVAVSAASTITNYAGNITKPALDARFQEYTWGA